MTRHFARFLWKTSNTRVLNLKQESRKEQEGREDRKTKQKDRTKKYRRTEKSLREKI
jgi:hypothetical protein